MGEMAQTTGGARLGKGARFGLGYLGALLVAQGLGKLIDTGGYVEALRAFQVFPQDGTWTAAIIWLVAELLCGAALFTFAVGSGNDRAPRPVQASGAHRTAGVLSASAALIIALAYAGLTTSAYLRGLAIDNCTCFGVYLPQRLSWFVLVQDVLVVWWSLWALRASRRVAPRSPGALTTTPRACASATP
jgi:hypothetical protein